MKLEKRCLVMVVVGLLGACSSLKDDPAQSNAGTGAAAVGGVTAGSGAAGTGASGISAAGAGGVGPGAGSGATAGSGASAGMGSAGTNSADGGDVTGSFDAGQTEDDPCDYKMQAVPLAADLTIPAGTRVHVCPGVTFTAASADVKVDVLGELIVDGSEAAPVNFIATGTVPRSWHGIVVENGGKLKLSHAKVSGALYGLFTNAGASFSVDASQFDTSFKTAVLQSAGTISNSKFIASAPPTIAITDGVTIDDPNGSMTVIDASPQITNCTFDGASAFTDLIRVGGNSAATFDHVSLTSAHCGFHTSGGMNTSIHVTNSVIQKMSYGIMAYATKPIIEDSQFMMNTNDVGVCSGATSANTPVLMGNNYAQGSPTVDPGCFMIGTKDPSPAATPKADIGSTIK